MSEFIKGCSLLKPLSPATFTSNCIVAYRAARAARAACPVTPRAR